MFDFNRAAPFYDEFYRTAYGQKVDLFEKKAVRKLLGRMDQTGKTLEIGAGTGHWTKFLGERGFFVEGIDIAGKMLEKACEKKIPNCRFQKASATDLPFDDQSFNNVFSFATLEFVENRDQAFLEINRVLRPGGHLLVGVLNNRGSIGKVKEKDEVFRDAHFFTSEELENALAAFGNPIIKGCALLPFRKKFLFAARLTERIAPPSRLRKKGNFLAGYVQKTK